MSSLIAGVFEAVVLVLAVTAAVSMADGGSGPSIDVIVPIDSVSVPVLLVSAAVGSVLVALLHWGVAVSTANFSSQTLGGLRRRAIEAYASAGWDRQSDESEGALQDTVGVLSSQSAQLATQFINALSSLLSLVALLLVAFVTDFSAAATVAVLGAFMALLLRPLTLAARRRADAYVSNAAALNEEVSSLTRTTFERRVFGTLRAKVEVLEHSNLENQGDLQRLRRLSRVNAMVFKDMAVLILILLLGLLYLAGSVNVVAVGSVTVIIVRGIGYAQQGQAASQAALENIPSLVLAMDRIASLESSREAAGDLPLESIGDVWLDNVSYAYPDGRVGISDINLDILQGARLGVIGPSGGGKSTLAQVLLGLRRPQVGRVIVGGVDMSRVRDRDLRRLIAVVPQDPQFFAGSVAENLRFGREGIPFADLERAAAHAHVLDEILSLPGGFDAMLGPRGSGVSGGQRQRMAIARALAGSPELIVMDEPTSALDPISERRIQETIEGLPSTVSLVIIAHRLSTLRELDSVVGMQAGKIVATGTLAEVAELVEFNDVERLQPDGFASARTNDGIAR